MGKRMSIWRRLRRLNLWGVREQTVREAEEEGGRVVLVGGLGRRDMCFDIGVVLLERHWLWIVALHGSSSECLLLLAAIYIHPNLIFPMTWLGTRCISAHVVLAMHRRLDCYLSLVFHFLISLLSTSSNLISSKTPRLSLIRVFMFRFDVHIYFCLLACWLATVFSMLVDFRIS